MTDKGRIRLAEAMGLRKVNMTVDDPEMYGIQLPDMQYDFHPLTNAKDDYAVLEWMRKDDQRISGIRLAEWTNFIGALPDNWQYQIGNYARAALKVLPLEKADE